MQRPERTVVGGRWSVGGRRSSPPCCRCRYAHAHPTTKTGTIVGPSSDVHTRPRYTPCCLPTATLNTSLHPPCLPCTLSLARSLPRCPQSVLCSLQPAHAHDRPSPRRSSPPPTALRHHGLAHRSPEAECADDRSKHWVVLSLTPHSYPRHHPTCHPRRRTSPYTVATHLTLPSDLVFSGKCWSLTARHAA